MRHFPDLGSQVTSNARVARLFELHRQKDIQTLLNDAGDVADALRPDIALKLRERAIRSLRWRQS